MEDPTETFAKGGDGLRSIIYDCFHLQLNSTSLFLKSQSQRSRPFGDYIHKLICLRNRICYIGVRGHCQRGMRVAGNHL